MERLVCRGRDKRVWKETEVGVVRKKLVRVGAYLKRINIVREVGLVEAELFV